MAGHSFRVSLAGEALLPSLMVWSLTVSRVCFSRESAGAEWAACGRAYAGGGSGGVRGVFCHKKSYKVLGCLEPWQPSCSRKGKKRILMEEWVAGFGKREGKGQLSVSTLIGAGKGAVEGCYGQEEGRGKAGREKNRDVRGKEEAKRRHKGHTPSLTVWKGSWHRGPCPWNPMVPICETHAYPWQMLSQDSPSLKGSRSPPDGSCRLPVLLITLRIPLWSLFCIKPSRPVLQKFVFLVKIALFHIPGRGECHLILHSS